MLRTDTRQTRIKRTFFRIFVADSLPTQPMHTSATDALQLSNPSQEPLHIAFVIHNQAETGPYWKVLEQCAAYVRLGHKATIFCTSKTHRFVGKERLADGVRVIEAPDLLWGKLRQGVDVWNALWRCVRGSRERFDVIHAVDCRPTVILPARFLQRSQRIPLVLAWWDLFGSESKRFGELYARTAGKVEGWLETSFRRYADGSVAITHALAERLRGLGLPPENIVVEHLGVDSSVQPLGYTQARKRLAEKHSIGVEENIFCFAGTIYDADFSLLLAALDVLKQEHTPFRVIWIGKHQIPSEVQVEYNIKHLGLVQTTSEVYEYFAAADACLLPMEVNAGNMARWPSKVTDYLNAGCPVALTPVSDFPELFKRYDLGWMAHSDSPADYAAALKRALADKPMREARSATTREFMRRELDVMAIAERTIALYQRCTTTLNSHAQRTNE
jgi:glycosyltransferase involved in cell wall biosynthesis